ncbi:MAG: sugar phosphate isomerase/epimerase [Clostridia bacterium]|nr:sugar phosphate isomerase/epimerase [Clostridia bacterium]
MYDFKIALQLYSVRDDMEKDFEGTLRKVKAMGYEGVEFAGLFGKTAAEVKNICKEIGLIPFSAHIPYADMVKDNDLLKVYKEIGCEYVIIPYLVEQDRPGKPAFNDVIENAKILGKKANELGMKLGYHNHDFEFVKLGDEYALDVLYNNVPAELLTTQLDTCWVNVAGENPAEYIRKYDGRVEVVHLKDFVGSKSENMYALIGIDDDKKKEIEGEFDFRPVGYGVQNFPEILKASHEVGAKWVVIELDRPSMGKTAIECVEMSLNYLKTII